MVLVCAVQALSLFKFTLVVGRNERCVAAFFGSTTCQQVPGSASPKIRNRDPQPDSAPGPSWHDGIP